jgi:ADP-ribosylglycohydrolase
VIGLFYAHDPKTLVGHARTSALVTHAHPLGQESAVLIALATSLAISEHSPLELINLLRAQSLDDVFRQRLETASSWLGSEGVQPAMVRKSLGNGITAAESCITALYIALKFLGSSFEAMLSFVAACKGDVDTIGAMAGAIWAHEMA